MEQYFLVREISADVNVELIVVLNEKTYSSNIYQLIKDILAAIPEYTNSLFIFVCTSSNSDVFVADSS